MHLNYEIAAASFEAQANQNPISVVFYLPTKKPLGEITADDLRIMGASQKIPERYAIKVVAVTYPDPSNEKNWTEDIFIKPIEDGKPGMVHVPQNANQVTLAELALAQLRSYDSENAEPAKNPVSPPFLSPDGLVSRVRVVLASTRAKY